MNPAEEGELLSKVLPLQIGHESNKACTVEYQQRHIVKYETPDTHRPCTA